MNFALSGEFSESPNNGRIAKLAKAKEDALSESLTRDDVRAALDDMPHPSKWRRELGETALDWVEWMKGNPWKESTAKVAKYVALLVSEMDKSDQLCFF